MTKGIVAIAAVFGMLAITFAFAAHRYFITWVAYTTKKLVKKGHWLKSHGHFVKRHGHRVWVEALYRTIDHPATYETVTVPAVYQSQCH